MAGLFEQFSQNARADTPRGPHPIGVEAVEKHDHILIQTAFGPLAKEFNDAGLTLVAISSDDAPGLKSSIENYKDGPMPIMLLSNSDLSAFKSYRCHDDFEKKPLHGTFVIDGNGLVRWQDIGFEPFQDAKFLLSEAKRLLSQPTAPATQTTTATAATGQ